MSKIETLNDLKTFLNNLNDDQLNNPAVLHIVDSMNVPILSAEVSEEDEFLTDEGFAPVSTHSSEDDEPLESYEIRKAGHPYLYNE